MRYILSVIAILWAVGGCVPPTQPRENQPPETFVFIAPPDSATMLDTTTSLQVVAWYGNDPDGEVVGFYYAWNDTSDWVWTEQWQDTFQLMLVTPESVFVFFVKAVDDSGAVDPTPASVALPVENSFPSIRFRAGSNPPPGVNLTTLSVRSFFWEATDPDGDETIEGYLYAVDDTTVWEFIDDPDARHITLTGLSPGTHRFFVKAVDVAGGMSDVIFYPDTGDTWWVEEVKGNVLLVDDAALESGEDATIFYTTMLDSLFTPDGYTYWDIGNDVNFPYSTIDIDSTLALFDIVVWYTSWAGDEGKLATSANSIRKFRERGGKVFLTVSPSMRPYDDDGVVYAFLPVDTSALVVDLPRDRRLYTTAVVDSLWGTVLYSTQVVLMPDTTQEFDTLATLWDSTFVTADEDTLTGTLLVGLAMPDIVAPELVYLQFPVYGYTGDSLNVTFFTQLISLLEGK